LIISAALDPTLDGAVFPLGFESSIEELGMAASGADCVLSFVGVPSKEEPFNMVPRPPSIDSFEVWADIVDCETSVLEGGKVDVGRMPFV
jgi:hypothetical protein